MMKVRSYPSLRREPTFAGLPARIAGLVIGGLVLLVAAAGISLLSLVVAAFGYLVIAVLLRPQLDRQPELFDIFPALFRYQARYDRHGHLGREPRPETFIRSRPRI